MDKDSVVPKEYREGHWAYYSIHSVIGPHTIQHFSSKMLDADLFPNLKWEDEPIEVGLIELNATNEELIDDTIVLTRYYEDYEKEHERFVNMLKHQERYKDCTDEEVEEIWKNHIKEEYTFDEIWNTIQCEGYTKIVLRMGRHDIQPDYDYVCESKEYIDTKIKKYL